MKTYLFRPAFAWAAALTLGVALSSCNSEPKATDADNTATVISSETNAASDSAATTVNADSSGMGTTTEK